MWSSQIWIFHIFDFLLFHFLMFPGFHLLSGTIISGKLFVTIVPYREKPFKTIIAGCPSCGFTHWGLDRLSNINNLEQIFTLNRYLHSFTSMLLFLWLSSSFPAVNWSLSIVTRNIQIETARANEHFIMILALY